MKRLVFDCFPGGRRKALHMSFDDGQVYDRRLVALFNEHGIKGSFFLNSGYLDCEGYLRSEEVAGLFAEHEVGVHGVTHPCLSHLPNERIIEEILEDRRALERLVGYVVRGMSYPGCDFNDRVLAMLPMLGIAYARTCEKRSDFLIPDDVYRWPMSCHQSQALQRAEDFLRVPPAWGLQLFFVMGHSFEFESGWDDIEAFCKLMGRREDIWYATNIEIADYLLAMQSIHVSADGQILTNPSAQPVWCSLWKDGKPGETLVIESGQTIRLTTITR